MLEWSAVQHIARAHNKGSNITFILNILPHQPTPDTIYLHATIAATGYICIYLYSPMHFHHQIDYLISLFFFPINNTRNFIRIDACLSDAPYNMCGHRWQCVQPTHMRIKSVSQFLQPLTTGCRYILLYMYAHLLIYTIHQRHDVYMVV